MLRVAKFTFNPFAENTYVVHDGREALVIDPGCWNSGEEHELEHYLVQNGLVPVRLVLTHAHIDHVFGCAWMHTRYGLLPEVHRADLELLRRAPDAARLYGLHCEPSPEPKEFLVDEQTIDLGGHTLEVLFTPGHAPGHVSLYCPAQKFILSGDVLFQRSIGRTDLPGGDFPTLERSIREKLYTLPEDTLVYCGHGPETTIGDEKRHNPFVTGI